jgi:8-amino-7-oxononanoate synthase
VLESVGIGAIQSRAKGRILPSDAAVICWELPSVAIALEVSAALRVNGIFAPAIRPPTVPTSRIRLTVCAGHSQGDLERLGEVLKVMVG